MADEQATSVGLSPLVQAFIRSMVVKMTREAVGQMLLEAQRLGLQWSLRPGTVGTTDLSAFETFADPMRVPVAMDGTETGDTEPVMSLVGVPPPGSRVMVASVPPVGRYILGYAGGPGASTDDRRYTTPGTSTWRKPKFARLVWARVQAGGGAGGGAAATAGGQASAGQGGQGGGYAESLFLAQEVPQEVTVTVGAGGTGVSGSPGNDGDTSSFGALADAGGGNGGAAAAGASGTPSHAAGNGPAQTINGQIEIPGGPGGPAIRYTATNGLGGQGGDSQMGRGGLVVAPNNAGADGSGFGGGGSGAGNNASQSARAGGDGSDGGVFVRTIF